MSRLTGKVAVVTGGASSLGLALARRLAAEGAQVAVADRDGPGATRAAAELGGLGVETDVTSSTAVDALRDAVLARYGRADIVVNNAGVHLQKLAIAISDADWDTVQHTNTRGVFYVCRAFGPTLMRQGSGRVLNIITRLGGGNPYSSAYIASKAAIAGFSQCLAMELAPYGVTVNCVAPGHIGPGSGMETFFRQKAELLGQDWDEYEQAVLRSIPLGRWCNFDDVAGAVAYLAGDEAAFITGETLNVSGGWTAYGTAPRKLTAEELEQEHPR
jgi:NAD(P)-dependent dehydrogenase (short-subunit alcohol dehydrogenase family)